MTTATFDWGRPGKPEHGVLSVKAWHLSVSGANRGHLPLEKVTYAIVGPCVSVSHVSLLDLPGLRRDLLGRATLTV